MRLRSRASRGGIPKQSLGTTIGDAFPSGGWERQGFGGISKRGLGMTGESVGGGGVVFVGGGMHFGALHAQNDEAGVQGVRQGVVVYRSSGNNAV